MDVFQVSKSAPLNFSIMHVRSVKIEIKTNNFQSEFLFSDHARCRFAEDG